MSSDTRTRDPQQASTSVAGVLVGSSLERASLEAFVDMRWRGQHGIGRYAREVLPRLDVAWRPLGVDGDPASPAGTLRRVPRMARDTLIYSPGYNSLLHAHRQLVTVHDLIHLQAQGLGAVKYHAYYDAVLRPRLRRDRMVITVSETSRGAIAAWLNDDRVTIVNAGNGCSPVFTADGPVFEAERPYVLYVGNLRMHKNVDVVLDAIAGCPDVSLRMVVPPRDVDEATHRAVVRGIDERVAVVTALTDEELAATYRGAAATVVPSLYEGFGLPALESISCGTPVVHWMGCAAVAETVRHRGVAVESATLARAWSDAIAHYIGHPTRVDPPSADQFSWERTATIVSDAVRAMAA